MARVLPQQLAEHAGHEEAELGVRRLEALQHVHCTQQQTASASVWTTGTKTRRRRRGKTHCKTYSTLIQLYTIMYIVVMHNSCIYNVHVYTDR